MFKLQTRIVIRNLRISGKKLPITVYTLYMIPHFMCSYTCLCVVEYVCTCNMVTNTTKLTTRLLTSPKVVFFVKPDISKRELTEITKSCLVRFLSRIKVFHPGEIVYIRVLSVIFVKQYITHTLLLVTPYL